MYFIEPSLDLGIIAALLDCFATTRNKHMHWSLPQRIRMCNAFTVKLLNTSVNFYVNIFLKVILT